MSDLNLTPETKVERPPTPRPSAEDSASISSRPADEAPHSSEPPKRKPQKQKDAVGTENEEEQIVVLMGPDADAPSDSLEALTLKELKEIAKERGVAIANMNKKAIVAALNAAA